MSVFAMPSLGADMEAGTLVEWTVKPGDTVRRGDVVAVVETQKGAIEIEIFEEGVIERLEAKIGDRLPVGAPLALVRGAGEAATSVPTPAGNAAPAETAAPAVPPAIPSTSAVHAEAVGLVPPVPPPHGALPPSSPAARARASEAGIDLAAIAGTGPGGAILLTDVEAVIARGPAPYRAPPSDQTALPASERHGAKPGLDPEAMRAAIAAAMAKSKREIPHYYLWQEVDLQRATDWLAARNASRSPDQRVLMGVLFVKAAALAAKAVPEVNGRHDGTAFRPAASVHAGIAVALRGGGLIAPAVRDADARSLDDLMAAMRDMVARTRTGRLRSSEMTDGTITVSSMGDTGTDAVLGVIYPPQVALVGFGAPLLRPWVVEGRVEPRTAVTVSLSADHRASDGRQGARFLSEIARLLQEPDTL